MKKTHKAKPHIHKTSGQWCVTGWGRTIQTPSYQAAQSITKWGYEYIQSNPHGSLIARRKLRALLALGIHIFDLGSEETPTSCLLESLKDSGHIHPVTQQYINQLWDKHNGDSFRPHPNYGPHVFWSVPLEWDNIENPDEKHKDQTLERPKVWVDLIIRSGLTTPLAAACDTKKETIYSWRRQGAPEKHFHKIYNFYLKAYEAHDNKT